jgi:pectinesterase
MRCARHILLSFTVLALVSVAWAGDRADIVLTPDGGRSIQDAINSVPINNLRTVIILLKNGIYREKVYVQRNNIALVGEDRDSTRIIFPELRESWNKEHNGSDWGSAVINIDSNATDITLANLTVYNNYGWTNDVFNKHQFTIRGGGTRVILLNCTVKSDGGDALSLWNKQNGMYYHADCQFEGWVDYVCPRGWCYITRSSFFGHNLSASIWHDGDYDRNEKFVIRDSYFDGVPGFPLGRNHRDGQIFLIDCRFSSRMADRPIYHPPGSKTEWQWGARHYYYGCHREGVDYSWYRDNLESATGSPRYEEISSQWAFDGKWNPEAQMPAVLPCAFPVFPWSVNMPVDPWDIALAWVAGRNANAHRVFLGTAAEQNLLTEQQETTYRVAQLDPGATYYWRVDEITDDGIIRGPVWKFRTADRKQ